MKFLSLIINGTPVPAPSGVPTGGLDLGGGGQRIIQLGIELIFIVGIVLSVIFIILSGIQWIISGGDKEKISKARARLTYSVVGLIVIAGAFFIVSTVISLLGGNPLFFFNTGSTSVSRIN